MNKLAIPAILAATVLVAGIFAFMPVEQASTVHISGTITTASDADIDTILTNTGTILTNTGTTLQANIEDQRRGLYFNTHVTGADIDEILVPLATGEAFSAHVVLSSSGSNACNLETDGDVTLLAGAANAVTTITLTNSNAGSANPAAFTDGIDIELDTPANTECSVTMVITQFE